jgi:hypothetical protein
MGLLRRHKDNDTGMQGCLDLHLMVLCYNSTYVNGAAFVFSHLEMFSHSGKVDVLKRLTLSDYCLIGRGHFTSDAFLPFLSCVAHLPVSADPAASILPASLALVATSRGTISLQPLGRS